MTRAIIFHQQARQYTLFFILVLTALLLVFAGAVSADSKTNPGAEKAAGALRTIGAYPYDSRRLGHTVTLLANGAVFIYGALPPGMTRDGSVILNPKERIQSAGSNEHGAIRWNAELNGWQNFEHPPECPHTAYQQTATQLPGNRILFAGGICDIPRFSNDFSPYPPAFNKLSLWNDNTQKWEKAPTLITARLYHSATLLNDGSVLFAGGERDEKTDESLEPVLDSAELYTDATDSHPAQLLPVDPLHIARAKHTATRLMDGKVLVAGGIDKNNKPLASVEIFDPATLSWAVVSELTTARYRHSATLLSDGRVMIAGGVNQNGDDISSVEIFDPQSKTWSEGRPLLLPLQKHSAVLLSSGDVLIIGTALGELQTKVARAILWKAATGDWQPAGNLNADTLANMQEANSNNLVPLNNGSALVFAQNDIMLWAPSVQAGSYFPSAEHLGHTMAQLKDGRLLLAGGHLYDKAMDLTEIYDPVSNRFSLSARMNQARYAGISPLPSLVLDDGRVVVAGGWVKDPNSPKKSIDNFPEIWEPATGQWSLINNLHFAAEDNVRMAKLDDGRVLFFASRDNEPVTGSAEFHAWLWDPDRNQTEIKIVTAKPRTKAGIALLPDGRVLIVGGKTLEHLPAKHCPPTQDNTSQAQYCFEEPEQWRELPENSAEIWDSRTGASSPAVYPPNWNAEHPQTLVLKNGNVLLVNMMYPDPYKKAEPAPLLVWNAQTGDWSKLPALGTDINWPITEHNDGSLIAWGNEYVGPTEAQVLKPGALAWEPMPRYPQRRAIVKSMPSGKLLALSPKAPYAAEYDEQTKEWRLLLNYYLQTRKPTLLDLGNDQLAVLGTVLGNKTLAQYWDKKTNTWSSTGKLQDKSIQGQAVRLPSGSFINLNKDYSDKLICNIWNPDNDSWEFCGTVTSPDTKNFPNFMLGNLDDGRAILMASGIQALVFNEETLNSTEMEVEWNNQFYHFGEAVRGDKPFARLYDRPKNEWHDANEIGGKFYALHQNYNLLWDAQKNRWAYISNNFMGDHPFWLPDRCVISGPPFKIYNPGTGKVTELTAPVIDLKDTATTVLKDGAVIVAGESHGANETGSGFFARKASCAGFAASSEDSFFIPGNLWEPAPPAPATKPTASATNDPAPWWTVFADFAETYKWSLLAVLGPLLLYFLLRHQTPSYAGGKVPQSGPNSTKWLMTNLASKIIFYGLLILLVPIVWLMVQSRLIEIARSCPASQNQNLRSEQINACIKQKIGPVGSFLYNSIKKPSTLPCRYIGAWSSTRAGVSHRVTLLDDGRFLYDDAKMPHEQETKALQQGYWEVQGDTMVWYYGKNEADPDINEIKPNKDGSFILTEEDGKHTKFELIEAIKSRTCTP